tara:strand:+ start:2851 stop:5646 length:2796 start_codon:yes stop_codon:yes gene_type:complete
MAQIPTNDYGSRVDSTDPSMPQGKAKNIVGTTQGTGTPLEANWVNDDWGFKQAILKEAGITPSGVPDNADDSQYLEGLKSVINAGDTGRDAKIAALEVNDAIQDAEIADLQAGQTGGIIVFSTYALLDAYTPQNTEEERTSYKVTNDPDSSLNGYYSWVSGDTYTKDANLVLNVIDENNTSDAVSGKAVSDQLKPTKSYALKKSASIPVDINTGDFIYYHCEAGDHTFSNALDSNGSPIVVSLAKDSIIRLKKELTGFTFEKALNISAEGGGNLIADFGGDAVVCRNLGFRVDDHTPFDTGVGAISMEFEFTLDHTSGGLASIVGYGTILTENAITVAMFSDYSRLLVGVGTLSDNLFYVFDLEQGTRYHVVYTLDQTSAKVYVNGVLAQEKPSTAYDLTVSPEFNIGGYYNFNDQQNLFRSPLHLYRHFNRALTEQEVIELYNYGDTLQHYEDTSLLLELNANASDGKSWVDTSGKENHPYLVLKTGEPALQKVDVLKASVLRAEGGGSILSKVPSENFFKEENVLYDTLIDSTSGVLVPWVGQSTISGAVRIDIDDNATGWYKVHGIDQNFGGYKMIVAAYNAANARLGLITPSEINHRTFNSFHANGPVAIVYITMYRSASFDNETPDLSNVYIEKIEDENDLYGTDRSNADTEELSKAVSLYNISNSNELVTVSKLFKDKRLLVLGDSIAASNQWLGLMTKKLGLVKVINSAIGGGAIYGSEDPSPAGDNNRQLTQQLRFTPFFHDTAIRSYGEFDGVDHVFSPDNIIMAFGFNDANNNWPIGDWSVIKTLDWRAMPLDTVQAYLRYNIEKMLSDVIDYQIPINSTETEIKNVAIDCRKSKVIYQLPINTSMSDTINNQLQDVRDAIAEVCLEYSIPMINAKDNSGISRLVELNTGGKYLKDGIHPNVDGYKKLAECNTSAFVSLAL